MLIKQPELSQAPGKHMKHQECLCSHIKLLEIPFGQHFYRYLNARCMMHNACGIIFHLGEKLQINHLRTFL